MIFKMNKNLSWSKNWIFLSNILLVLVRVSRCWSNLAKMANSRFWTLGLCLDRRFPRLRFAFASFFFFFFFFTRFAKRGYCSMNSNRKSWLFGFKQYIMYCSWTHKFHFLSIFSLKMGPTVLFTHLKIILLQWFQQ